MSFCEAKPPEQVWYDCEREGEQQSGMTQRDGPLSVAKPEGLGDSAAVLAFQTAECGGRRAVPEPPYLSFLNFRPCRHRRDKLRRHWDAAVYPADSLESD
jgi:hypothetical protein